ncbi:PAS domain-containing protein [Planktotalea sp.]|uniref:PAS domain-containing protein n=1 Tax=Planktotalea sp. TaxID=2029877 RepID=UPI0032969794
MSKDLILDHTDAGTSNVVSIMRNAPLANFPGCRDLHAYWDALRGARIMPTRNEFDPRGVASTLSNTFIAEKIAPRVARIRVAGTVMNDVLGMDVRGMPLTSFFDPEARDVIAEATTEIFNNPSMVVLELTARVGITRKIIQGRMLLLPMSDEEGDVSRIAGCLDLPKGLNRKPRRFQVASLRSSNLTGDPVRALPNQVPEFTRPTEQPSYAFAEKPTVFRSQRTVSSTLQTPKPSGLRLVVCND